MRCPQPSTIPINDSIASSVFQVDYKSDMLLGRRVSDERQTSHFRLQDDTVVIAQANQNSLCNSINACDAH
jgi:hypothetical protein